ncbi:MAG: transglutaminase family protein [Candidatus Obscuribacterales bacterium]|nr:transglutaminase family protein [Candidatus Obscuribacterales bacterium]
MFNSQLAIVLSGLSLSASVLPAAALDCPYLDARSISSKPVQKIYGKLDIDVIPDSSFEAHQWSVYMADAPETAGQSEVASRLTLADGTEGSRVGEIGGEGRSVLLAQSNNAKFAHCLKFSGEYWATLHKRSLATNHSTQHVWLSAEEREKYLRETRSYDFSQPVFKDWIAGNGLEKRSQETSIGFAWRVFDFLRSKYSYKYIPTQPRNASSLCRFSETDCGGSCYLFVSVLRRNGIPARAIAGRWAKSSTHVEESGTAELGTFHVRAEFFAPDIGWVPVDISRAMGAPDEKVIRLFGNDDGRFFVMHIDPDFILQSVLFGEKYVRMLQRCAYWAKGTGNFSKKSEIVWTVTNEKLTN